MNERQNFTSLCLLDGCPSFAFRKRGTNSLWDQAYTKCNLKTLKKMFKITNKNENFICFLTLSRRGGGHCRPLTWISLPLSQGQGYVNQTSRLCSFWYLPVPRKPVLVFIFQKIEKIRCWKFWGASSIRWISEKIKTKSF